jgi:hypothetical protein
MLLENFGKSHHDTYHEGNLLTGLGAGRQKHEVVSFGFSAREDFNRKFPLIVMGIVIKETLAGFKGGTLEKPGGGALHSS